MTPLREATLPSRDGTPPGRARSWIERRAHGPMPPDALDRLGRIHGYSVFLEPFLEWGKRASNVIRARSAR
jgi:hypothetical protein